MSAYKWRQDVESGRRVMVGVNKYVSPDPDQTAVFQPDPEAAGLALADLDRHRRERDAARCAEAVSNLRTAALSVQAGQNVGAVMAGLVAAAEADATLGEMQAVLHDVFGRNK